MIDYHFFCEYLCLMCMSAILLYILLKHAIDTILFD